MFLNNLIKLCDEDKAFFQIIKCIDGDYWVQIYNFDVSVENKSYSVDTAIENVLTQWKNK